MIIEVKKQKIGVELKTFISRSIHEILEDPDFGLELTEGAKKRLRIAALRRQKWTPISDILKRYY